MNVGQALHGSARALLCAFVFCVMGPIGLMGPIRCASAAAAVNPTARLKIVKTTTLWKSPDGKVSAQRARFSPYGRWLAWFTSNGKVFLADMRNNKVTTLAAPPVSTFSDLVWSRRRKLALCVRTVKDGTVTRWVAVVRPKQANLELVKDTTGAYNVAWRDDDKAIAFSTKTALLHRDLRAGKTVKLLDQQKGWRPKQAPAYQDLVFVGGTVAARAAGTMKWWLVAPGKKPVALGECRGLRPDPERNRLYIVPWLAGPVKIPRGAGVVCTDPREKHPKRRVVVPFDHTTGKPYWLVDIFDAMYPTTLRLSPDGKTLTFCGVKAGVLSKNAWREFCIWRVPADGSKPPEAVARCGPIFKRIDVGDTHFIGWRYKIDPAIVLGNLKNLRAWRLPKDFYVQRRNTDVLVDELLVGAARGKDVVLIRLEEEDQ